MSQPDKPDATPWGDRDTALFVDYGRYFVPERDLQFRILCDLLPRHDQPIRVLELCCGEGLLAELLLERIPNSSLWAFDGSAAMLRRARQRLQAYGDRVHFQQFDLAEHNWRQFPFSFHAVISSLAIHHLDTAQKQMLYQDIHARLAPQGILLVADLIQPVTPLGTNLAAELWDESVQQAARDNDEVTAFEYFEREKWNHFRYPDPVDQPSPLFDQMKWLEAAGFQQVEVYWMKAGHAIWGGWKANNRAQKAKTAV